MVKELFFVRMVQYKRKKKFVAVLTAFFLLVGQMGSATGVGETAPKPVRNAQVSDAKESTDSSLDFSDTDPAAGTSTPGATSSVQPVPEETPQNTPELQDIADLRIIFTSDTHGQVTTEDFEKGSVFQEGGYSKAATLIGQARGEVSQNNSLLFDLGDNFCDYTTDFIYNYNSEAQQPIYTALSKMGYDAITLGNHEFNYTLPYLQAQLAGAGLTDKVVLSNVKDSNTGETVWAENKIIEKQVVTDTGRTIPVKVGLIGETVPELSPARSDYTGILTTEGIVENAKKEAASLKAQGADIVVVLAHSGIGDEEPEDMTQNAGYALTKIDGIDAVLCGHLHSDFPSDSGTKYDDYPGVDLDTGLVNGKNLIQLKPRGASVGVADLFLSDAGGKISIVDRKTEIRKVKADTEVNQDINSCMGEDWRKIFISDCTEILCDIDEDTDFQNYFGTQEDTDAIQLLNNIKISYGLRCVHTDKTEYKDYPVVAASSYLKYGSGAADNYIDVRKEFKRSNMYGLIEYKTKQYIYEMDGSEIRDWLEWSASCYEEAGKNLLPLEEENGDAGGKRLQYALQKKYLSNWKKFYFFDGIEYSIDTTVPPRYDADGRLLNDTHRIVSLTRNGQEITDDQILVVVTDKLPDNELFNAMSLPQIKYISFDPYRNYVEDYIAKISMTGNMKPMADNNWSIKYSDSYNYVLRSSEEAQTKLAVRKWITGMLEGEDSYRDYRMEPDKIPSEDTTGPGLNAVILDESVTNKSGTIQVQATDISGVSSVKYAFGKFGTDNLVWDSASAVENGSFQYEKNGIYSIMAEDGKGNRSVFYIKAININQSMLAAPIVDEYTNRKKAITGTAEPGAKIYFNIEKGDTYSSKVDKKGAFNYALPPQNAGVRIFVYVVDDKGKTSASTTVTVKRTGPNKPKLNSIKSNTKTISGKLNDTYAYPIIQIGDTFYVQDKNVQTIYNSSDLYADDYKVEIVPVKITSSGTFRFTMQEYINANTSVKLRTVDSLARCSLLTSVKVKQAKPRLPVKVSNVTNRSKYVKVYSMEKCKNAVVKIGKKKYQSKKETYSKKKGYCYKVTIPRCDSVKKLKIFLSNAKGDGPAISLHPIEKVPDTPILDKVKRSAKKITGKVDLVGSDSDENTVKNTKTKVFIYINGKKRRAAVKKDGSFSVRLKKKARPKKKDKIVCVASNLNGSSAKRTVCVK